MFAIIVYMDYRHVCSRLSQLALLALYIGQMHAGVISRRVLVAAKHMSA